MPARIEGPGYRDIYRLHVWRRLRTDDVELLLEDGTWATVPSGTVIPENAGFVIPGQIFDDVFDAFLEYKGYKSHEPTEVKVLREWLNLEKARVDALVTRITDKAVR